MDSLRWVAVVAVVVVLFIQASTHTICRMRIDAVLFTPVGSFFVSAICVLLLSHYYQYHNGLEHRASPALCN